MSNKHEKKGMKKIPSIMNFGRRPDKKKTTMDQSNNTSGLVSAGGNSLSPVTSASSPRTASNPVAFIKHVSSLNSISSSSGGFKITTKTKKLKKSRKATKAAKIAAAKESYKTSKFGLRKKNTSTTMTHNEMPGEDIRSLMLDGLEDEDVGENASRLGYARLTSKSLVTNIPAPSAAPRFVKSNSESLKENKFWYSSFVAVGTRYKDEDLTLIREDISFFAVFDGHISRMAADFCEETMPKILASKIPKSIQNTPVNASGNTLKVVDSHAKAKEILHSTFIDTHEEARNKIDGSGCTAVVVWFYRLFESKEIFFIAANAGDARCVLAQSTTGETGSGLSRSLPPPSPAMPMPSSTAAIQADAASSTIGIEDLIDRKTDSKSLHNVRLKKSVKKKKDRKRFSIMRGISTTGVTSSFLLRKNRNIGKQLFGMSLSPSSIGTSGTVVETKNSIVGTTMNAVRLTVDHKATVPSEVERVKAAGGEIFGDCLEAALAITRGIGDFDFEPGFTAVPDISAPCSMGFSLTDVRDNKFLILSSDGIFDVVEDQEAVDAVHEKIVKDGARESSLHLGNLALEKGAVDDLSCIVISF